MPLNLSNKPFKLAINVFYMILEAEVKEPDEMPEILTEINNKNPHRRALHRLRVNKKRLDAIMEYYCSPFGDYLVRYFEDSKYVCLGPDNKFYLTKKGGDRAGLRPREINNPPDIRGQIQLFPLEEDT